MLCDIFTPCLKAIREKLPPRIQQVEKAITSIEKDPSEGNFNALGMLAVDSLITSDLDALEEMHDLLQRAYGDSVAGRTTALDPQTEGRILGFIDVLHWGLRRNPPVPELPEHALNLLETIANPDEIRRYSVDDPRVNDIYRLAQMGLMGLLLPRRLGESVYPEISERGKTLLRVQRTPLAEKQE